MKPGIISHILFPLGLGLLTLVLLLAIASVSDGGGPPGLRAILLTGGLLALATAAVRVVRLRGRLDELSAFLAAAARTTLLAATPPARPPVREDDEFGRLKHHLYRLLDTGRHDLQQLQSEKRELEALLHTLAYGVVVLDLNGTIVRCNPAALRLFGHAQTRPTAEDWHGRPFHELSRHPTLLQLLEDAEAPPAAPEVKTHEIEIEGPEPRQLAVSVLRLASAAGQSTQPAPSGSVLTCHDLTAIKQLESVRADFVANVSHELRTPLTAIKGYAETLLAGADQDSDLRQRFLAIIDRHSERLSRLIDDLLTLSNLELGRTELQREELQVADLIQEATDMVQEKAQRGAVRLSRSLPADLPPLSGDRDRLHQVLINLIDNAVKYTPPQGQVRVSAALHAGGDNGAGLRSLWAGHEAGVTVVEVDAERDWLEVAISDTGYGIPEADIPRLTQRFYRVDKARSRELGGTGLGLAIVKHIVLAHGGGLRIESRVTHGTTVRVALPVDTPVPVPNTPIA